MTQIQEYFNHLFHIHIYNMLNILHNKLKNDIDRTIPPRSYITLTLSHHSLILVLTFEYKPDIHMRISSVCFLSVFQISQPDFAAFCTDME